MSQDTVDDVEFADNRLVAVGDRIKARLTELRERKQALMGELVPMDAAIHELEQVLVTMGLMNTVETLVDDPYTLNAVDFMERVHSPGADTTLLASNGKRRTGAADPKSFVPTTRTVEKRPVTGTRTGPSGTPPSVGKDSGTPTNVEILRNALRGQG